MIKAQFSALDTAAKRGTSDETEATHQRAHDQRIRLEAVDCDGMRHVVQFACGRRQTPTTLPRSRSPHNARLCAVHAVPTRPSLGSHTTFGVGAVVGVV